MGRRFHKLRVKDVPVDGFWSVIVYDKTGYIPQNDRKVYSFNNLTAKPDADGSVTIQFGGDASGNCIPIVPDWNYTVRLYRAAQGNSRRHLEVSGSAGRELTIHLLLQPAADLRDSALD